MICSVNRKRILNSHVKQTSTYNRRVVLQTIRQRSPISKAEIARETNLTSQTISIIVNKLIEEDIVIATGNDNRHPEHS